MEGAKRNKRRRLGGRGVADWQLQVEDKMGMSNMAGQDLRREDKPWQSPSREMSSKNHLLKGQLNVNILISSLY